MLDFDNLDLYRENNRIEAKKALGGLPESIWETYSAFANTEGGVILLGVIEQEDKSFASVWLPDPELLVEDFLKDVNDPSIVSANILEPHHVRIEESGGHRIVVIEVPRADEALMPIYCGDDPVRGSYRRCGEGDYRMEPDEVRTLLERQKKE